MNAGNTLLAVYEPLPQWVNFLAVFVAVVLAAFGTLLWVVLFRKKRRRKRRKHHEHRGERKLNPTLADTGGLPPGHPAEKPSDPSLEA